MNRAHGLSSHNEFMKTPLYSRGAIGGRHCRVFGPRKALSLLLFTAAAVGVVINAAVYKRNESCESDCTPDAHTCTACRYEVVGDCPEGWIADPSAQREQVDVSSCEYTECTSGGCPADRAYEVKEQSQLCVNMDLSQCHTLTCRKEYCCRTVQLNKCCRQLNCTLEYEGCLVPEQLSKANSSASSVRMTHLPHGANSTFPFFRNLTVPAGQPCEKLWGSCSCFDGRLTPGCDASNSSSWTSLDRGPEALPPGLVLTCTAVQGCQVPQRWTPPPGSDPSDRAVRYVELPHGGSAVFAFFRTSSVPAGGMCQQAFGKCSCDNGSLVPGCSLTDSSSWWDVDAGGAPRRLDAGLFVDCTEEEEADTSSSSKKGLLLAGGIASAVLLVLVLLAGLTWYFRAHLRFKRWSQLRLGSSYEPVQTGALDRPTGGFGGISDALGSFSTMGPGARKQSKAQASGSRLRGGHDPVRPLPIPATPDDDVFTLEDLDHDHRDHYPVLPVSRRAEVELHTHPAGFSQNRPHHTTSERPGAADQQPLLPPPAAPTRHAAAPATTGAFRPHAPEAATARQSQLEVDEEEGGEEEEQGLMNGSGKQHRRGGR